MQPSAVWKSISPIPMSNSVAAWQRRHPAALSRPAEELVFLLAETASASPNSSASRGPRAEFPVFQNVLELENDRGSAETRLAAIPDGATIRAEMADFILRNREFPTALQTQMAERLFLEQIGKGEIFSPLVLPETIHVSVNEKSGRPLCVVTWAVFDWRQYLADGLCGRHRGQLGQMLRLLVGRDDASSTLMSRFPCRSEGCSIPNWPRLRRFCRQQERGLFPDAGHHRHQYGQGFPHPSSQGVQAGRAGAVLFRRNYRKQRAHLTRSLSRVRKADNAWLLTWTVQEVFSKAERPAVKGFFSSTPAMQEFHIETNDLKPRAWGVSAYEKHALVPHDAYQRSMPQARRHRSSATTRSM